MEHLTYQCKHCTNTDHLSLLLNDWGELRFICEPCRAEQDAEASASSASEEDVSQQETAQEVEDMAPESALESLTENQYDLLYYRFEAVQNALCDWLDEMEDQGQLSASEHDALEASIYDAQP